MKSVAIILPFERKGGLEKMATVLAGFLSDRGYKVHFIMTKQDEDLYEERKEIDYVVLPHDKSKGRIKRVLDKLLFFRNYIKTNRIEAIISFGHFGTFYSIPGTVGIKVRHIEAVRTDPAKEPTKPILRKVRNFLYHCADCVVFQTEEGRDYFSKSIAKKSYVIPNPVPSDLPYRTGNERNKKIVNFCRLTEQKNLFLLIDAFADFSKGHSGYTLNIYGRGDIKDKIEAYIKDSGLENSVFLFDFVQNIHQVIIDSAMFVSSSDYEGISNSMLEAMAIGLPVICTDCPVGGARLAIQNGKNGILVPVKDKQALVNAMAFVADHPLQAEKMGNEAMKIRTEWSYENVLSKWLKLIEE